MLARALPSVAPDGRYAPAVMPEMTSRTELATIARLLLIATVLIVLDVRVPTADIVPDALGGALVLYAMLRLRSIVRGADATVLVLIVLAVLAAAAAVLETFGPVSGPVGLVALSQPAGALVLSWLLSRALSSTEPVLAGRWRLTAWLILWLGIVAVTAVILLGRSGTIQVETPLAIVLVAILAVPFVSLVVSLWRTAGPPEAHDLPTVVEDPA